MAGALTVPAAVIRFAQPGPASTRFRVRQGDDGYGIVALPSFVRKRTMWLH